MSDAPTNDLGPSSATEALRDLALEFKDRAQAAEAGLLAAFTARAASLAAGVAPIVFDDDDDERLVLTADGTFSGEVLDDASGTWVPVETPEDVVLYYDPTDIFLDLADALGERLDGDRAADAEAEAPAPGSDRDEPHDETEREPAAAGESATMAMLRDLRKSGALSDADFERLRSDLHLG